MIRTGQKPLVVHVVLQDADPAAENPTRALAVEIYTRLARGPRSTGIPVHVWMATGSMGALDLPEQAPLPDAERNAILLLVDQPFFEAREQWKRYLAVLDKALRRERDLLLPIAICKDAHWVARALNNINSVPVKDPKTVAEDEHVFQDILTAILRLLPEPSPESSLLQPSFGSAQESVAAPPPVFLCHTKRDGEGLARNLRQYIQNQTQLRCFFDLYDLPHGQTVKDFIQTSISVSCLLVVWTDSLLESRWCQFEILEARSQQRPLLVLDALSVDSPRIFPFLSNMPVLRWRDNPAQVVSALLLELVRTRHMRVLFGSLRDSDSQITSFVVHAPDIMEASSVLRPRKINLASIELASQLVVYPDPPLRSEELGFLRRAFPTLHLHSLSEWTALRAANALSNITAPPVKERPAPLSHLPVGLSVSETETWKRLGLIREHQDDFVVDMARELILLGARLLWGGDLRPDGLGMRLETLVDAYRPADRAPQDHIACYLAWPIHRKVTPKNLQERRAFADVRCQPRPNLTKSRSSAFDALCFSLMRREMAQDSQARIILGGKLKGYAGRYPGIAEEALETISFGRPLYIVGGFGGAARGVYDAIVHPNSETSLGDAWKDRIKDEKVQKTHASYDDLAQHLNLDLRVDHNQMLKCFKDLGLDELSRRNKLSPLENERLACSQDIHEIIALLVKGLSQLPVT